MDLEGIWIVKGIVYGTILLYTAVYDRKHRLIPGWIPITLMCIGLVKGNLSSSFIGLVLVPLPFLLVALTDSRSMGGGDIKFMAGNGFLLGFRAGILASVIGLTMAVIFNLHHFGAKENGTRVSIAMAPYLGAGCFLSYIISSFGG